MNVTDKQTALEGTSKQNAPRVGILTFHSQINYGGVLQAFALQDVLHRGGVRSRVIDYWTEPTNETLLGPFGKSKLKGVINVLMGSILGGGHGLATVRRWRTWQFIHRWLRLTPYHFNKWEEMEGRDLELDCIVAGSDQIWSPLGTEVFFLVGAPKDIPAISYAASLGGLCQKKALEPRYRKLLERFREISVREEVSVRLIAGLGLQSVCTLDPVQLLSAAQWRERFGLPQRAKRHKLVCYLMCTFLDDWLTERLGAFQAFAKRMNCEVEVFIDSPATAMARSPKGILKRWRLCLHYAAATRGIRFRRAGGPLEFLEAFASATWAVANSFHALQFSSIFGLNARIIRSTSYDTKAFTRLTDFKEKYVHGPLFADDVGDALASLERGEAVTFDEGALAADRERSLAWLRGALVNLK